MIKVQNIQHIQQLTLVLVQTLDLYIEYGIRVDGDAMFFLDILSKLLFVAALDLGQTAQNGRHRRKRPPAS